MCCRGTMKQHVIKRLKEGGIDGWQMGMRDSFFTNSLQQSMQIIHSYPELAETVDHVTSVIKREEESFLQPLTVDHTNQ